MSEERDDAPAGESLEAPAEPASAQGEEQAKAQLHETLLHGAPTSVERRPDSRWVYPLWGILLVSLFVAFHSATLLVWNLPGKGLSKQFNKDFLDKSYGRKYVSAARLSQSWAMFAPNPNRSNTFMRVFVEDQDGQLWDFEQDIWEEDRYPYWFYDRRGKVNRRLDGKKHYQRIYGAWVCREWERQHEGVPPKSVTFIKRWTKIPAPNQVIEKGGWNQWEAEYKQKEQETITCKTTVNAQLPPELRERYGLSPEGENDFRHVRHKTWWDKAEDERKKAERQAETEARRAKWQEEREEREAAREEQTPGKGSRGALRAKRVGSAPIDPRGPIAEPDSDDEAEVDEPEAEQSPDEGDADVGN
ncbi:hypothetical protein G6O69_35005 [Pseudenhygromyxa sp. WMMC2535]|uniref:hypothetical protein n=1 Tax=Pseudenhygromyxa sp. WMMC2535 TaxID=2712867 RepID=UPI0015547B93|nr:hypothetical protein [Pseudenhygromyxa sp. WMMC2535]NVB43085.1 hypothetical protein [Pseudenhygromyxa sp. WMMC2535]